MTKNIKEILNYQYIDWEANEVLKEIFEKDDSIVYSTHNAYNYGFIQGVRAERARRKKQVE